MGLIKRISKTTKILILSGFLGTSVFATGGYFLPMPAKPGIVLEAEQIEEELRNSLNLPQTREINTGEHYNNLIDRHLEIRNSPEYFGAVINYEDSRELADHGKDVLFGLSGLSFFPYILGFKRFCKEIRKPR